MGWNKAQHSRQPTREDNSKDGIWETCPGYSRSIRKNRDRQKSRKITRDFGVRACAWVRACVPSGLDFTFGHPKAHLDSLAIAMSVRLVFYLPTTVDYDALSLSLSTSPPSLSRSRSLGLRFVRKIHPTNLFIRVRHNIVPTRPKLRVTRHLIRSHSSYCSFLLVFGLLFEERNKSSFMQFLRKIKESEVGDNIGWDSVVGMNAQDRDWPMHAVVWLYSGTMRRIQCNEDCNPPLDHNQHALRSAPTRFPVLVCERLTRAILTRRNYTAKGTKRRMPSKCSY